MFVVTAAASSVLVVPATATMLLGYVSNHAVFEREPALARLACEWLFFGVGAHVSAQVFGRVETVQAERTQNLRKNQTQYVVSKEYFLRYF